MADIIIYNTADGKAEIKLYADNGTVWLTQAQIVDLFNSSKSSISEHIKNIFSEDELDENSVVRKIRTTAADGKNYLVSYYSLDVILAVGFRVRSSRGTQFRQWANNTLKEYLQKGFILDKDRLKNPDGRPDYFDELLEQIRNIRASEKRFYQKLRDLFALSSDYKITEKATDLLFADTQNKLHWQKSSYIIGPFFCIITWKREKDTNWPLSNSFLNLNTGGLYGLFNFDRKKK